MNLFSRLLELEKHVRILNERIVTFFSSFLNPTYLNAKNGCRDCIIAAYNTIQSPMT